MPVYLYRAVNEAHACKNCSEGFEVRQRMKDAPLKACPQCGAKVERIIQPVGISVNRYPKSLLSDRSLKKHGFSKFVKEDDKKYRRVV